MTGVDPLADAPLTFQGRIWTLGDNIDTDLIVPSRVLTERDPQKLLDATLESAIPGFAREVRQGDIIVAGANFGCGSSREEAVFVLKELGIRAVVAKSFARIFFRNAINLGLPPIQMENPLAIGSQGDRVVISLQESSLKNVESGQEWAFKPFPPFLLHYLEKGGAFGILH